MNYRDLITQTLQDHTVTFVWNYNGKVKGEETVVFDKNTITAVVVDSNAMQFKVWDSKKRSYEKGAKVMSYKDVSSSVRDLFTDLDHYVKYLNRLRSVANIDEVLSLGGQLTESRGIKMVDEPKLTIGDIDDENNGARFKFDEEGQSLTTENATIDCTGVNEDVQVSSLGVKFRREDGSVSIRANDDIDINYVVVFPAALPSSPGDVLQVESIVDGVVTLEFA